MGKLILASKAYLVLKSDNRELEAMLTRMGECVGFRCHRVDSDQELHEVLAKIKNLVAVVLSGEGSNVSPLLPALKNKVIELKKGQAPAEVIVRIEQQIANEIPKPLIELIQNATLQMGPKCIGPEFTKFARTSDFGLSFTNLVTCDTSADAFSAKALCLVNFEKIRKEYKSLNAKSDTQLTDVFGEYCNQLLGVINAGLRNIGLNPLVSLPIGAELSKTGNIAQVDYMPAIRMVDPWHALCVTVGIRIEPKCSANWKKLETVASTGSFEFL